MLKNMAIHELALLVSFFGVTVDTVDDFKLKTDAQCTEQLTIAGYTDFSKIGFTVKTKSGSEVSVMADRCGGNVSYASVAGADGAEVANTPLDAGHSFTNRPDAHIHGPKTN